MTSILFHNSNRSEQSKKLKEEYNKIVKQREKETEEWLSFHKKNNESILQKFEDEDRKERFKELHDFLSFEQAKNFELKTKRCFTNVLFDSDIHRWKKNDCEFYERIKNHSNVVFIVENREGKKYGNYLSSKIDKEDKYISDSNAFVFTFQNEVCSTYEILKEKEHWNYAMIIYPANNDRFMYNVGKIQAALIKPWADITVGKQNAFPRVTCCVQRSYDYKGKNHALAGTNAFSDTMRVLAIETVVPSVIYKTFKDPFETELKKKILNDMKMKRMNYVNETEWKEKISCISDWTGLSIGDVLFDSAIDDYGKRTSVFNERIKQKRHLLFVIENSENELFGYYLNSLIADSDNGMAMCVDKKAFHFTVQSENLKQPMKYEILDIYNGGYKMFSNYNSDLIHLGDLILMKEGEEYLCYYQQHDNLFDYKNKQKALMNKTGFFMMKRLIVVQMDMPIVNVAIEFDHTSCRFAYYNEFSRRYEMLRYQNGTTTCPITIDFSTSPFQYTSGTQTSIDNVHRLIGKKYENEEVLKAIKEQEYSVQINEDRDGNCSLVIPIPYLREITNNLTSVLDESMKVKSKERISLDILCLKKNVTSRNSNSLIEMKPEEIVGFFLLHLRELFCQQTQLHEDTQINVIFPVDKYTSIQQLDAYKQTILNGQMTFGRFLSKAEAAFYGYWNENIKRNGFTFVINLDDSECSVTILHIQHDGKIIKEHGREVNKEITIDTFAEKTIDLVIEQLKNTGRDWKMFSLNSRDVGNVKKMKMVKRNQLKKILFKGISELVKQNSVQLDLSELYSSSENNSYYNSYDNSCYIVLERDDVIRVNGELFQEIFEMFDLSLDQIYGNKKLLSNVILIGESANIPSLETIIEDKFGKSKVRKEVNPKETVVKGAAIYSQEVCGLIPTKIN